MYLRTPLLKQEATKGQFYAEVSKFEFRVGVWVWVLFYGISTIVDYLMLNPVYSYILDIYYL